MKFNEFDDLEKNEDEIRELTEKLDSGKLPDEKKKEAMFANMSS